MSVLRVLALVAVGLAAGCNPGENRNTKASSDKVGGEGGRISNEGGGHANPAGPGQAK
jgi:hypothetical protein